MLCTSTFKTVLHFPLKWIYQTPGRVSLSFSHIFTLIPSKLKLSDILGESHNSYLPNKKKSIITTASEHKLY